MKERKFYPRQIAKRLNGKSSESLDAGERAALRYFMRNSRKLGIALQTAKSDIAGLKRIGADQAQAIVANANSRILLR